MKESHELSYSKRCRDVRLFPFLKEVHYILISCSSLSTLLPFSFTAIPCYHRKLFKLIRIDIRSYYEFLGRRIRFCFRSFRIGGTLFVFIVSFYTRLLVYWTERKYPKISGIVFLPKKKLVIELFLVVSSNHRSFWDSSRLIP